MDDVARLPVADRSDLFAAAARRRGLTVEVIEKDFWVCWTLKRHLVSTCWPRGGRSGRRRRCCTRGIIPPADRKFRDRQSQHYYDVGRLYQHALGKATITVAELLLKVARHQKVFFPAA
jgi:hypothetical protein